MKRLLSVILIAAIIVLNIPAVFAAVGQPVAYDWNSVPMGAGGFVTGMAIHPTEPNLVYIRTDVGGAYRWSEAEKGWTQLCDSFGREESSFYGIDGIALDAQNPDLVYIAAGASLGAGSDVLKSSDRGKTWERTNLAGALTAAGYNNAGFSGNGANRGNGERIAVDPANGEVIYVGTINGGLWRSTDGADSWQPVPLPDYSPAETEEKQEIRIVCFDEGSVQDGITQTIYVGIKKVGIYQTTDGGQTWSKMEGAPVNPMRMAVAPNKGMLYVASMNGLFSYDKNSGTWAEISPREGIGQRFNAVDVDPYNDDALICMGPHTDNNYMEIPIWYSEDGGQTWVNKTKTSNRVSTLPWNPNPGFCSNGHCLLFDWNQRNSVWFMDWFCAWRTDDIVNGARQTWTYYYKGIEEIVPRDIACPPSGEYTMLAGVADNKGCPYRDPSQYPERQINPGHEYPKSPGLMSISDIDFCEENPNIVVTCGINWNAYGKMEISTDNTKTWKTIDSLPCYVDKDGNRLKDVQGCDALIPMGRVAVSAQLHPDTGLPVIVAIPAYEPNEGRFLPEGFTNSPIISYDLGETWKNVEGIVDEEGNPINVVTAHWDGNISLASDRVDGRYFYVMVTRQESERQVFVSDDWGATWQVKGALNADDVWLTHTLKLKAAPYMAGEVWATRGGALYRSSDYGNSFSYVNGVEDVVGFGFGKHAPDRENPTIYLYGSVNATEGIYRSIDMGETWCRINTDEHKFGCSPGLVEGDMQTFGRVYLGCGGRGVFYGEPNGDDTWTDPDETVTPQSYSKDMSSVNDLEGWKFYLNGQEQKNNGYKISSGWLANSDSTGSDRRSCIYESMVWSGNYTFAAHMRNRWGAPSNHAYLMFNYVNDTNHYYVDIGGTSNGRTTQVILGRNLAGQRTVLDSCTVTFPNSVSDGNDIVVRYSFGYITVSAMVDGVETVILRALDFELPQGKIGVGSEHSVAGFKNIRVNQSAPSISTPLWALACDAATEAGERVTDLASVQGQTIDVTATIKRISADCSKNGVLIVTLKDENGVLRSVAKTEFDVPNTELDQVTASVQIPEAAQNSWKLQAYLWNSAEKIQPLTKEISVI